MRIEEVHKDVDTYAYVHMVSLMRCCVYTHVLSQKKKKKRIKGDARRVVCEGHFLTLYSPSPLL